MQTGYFVYNNAASPIYFQLLPDTNPDVEFQKKYGYCAWRPSTLIGGVLGRSGCDNIQLFGPAARQHQEHFETFLQIGEVDCDGWEEFVYSTPIYPYTVTSRKMPHAWLILCETADGRPRTVPHHVAFGEEYPQVE